MAVHEARTIGHATEGCALDSDAFFPFRDSIEQVTEAGVTVIVQLGGSERENGPGGTGMARASPWPVANVRAMTPAKRWQPRVESSDPPARRRQGADSPPPPSGTAKVAVPRACEQPRRASSQGVRAAKACEQPRRAKSPSERWAATRSALRLRHSSARTEALRFAFDHGLGVPLPWVDVSPVHRPPRLPVVLSGTEVAAVLERLRGAKQSVAMLLYGSGLRLMEALTLRVKDLDFERSTLIVRSGKGDKGRATVLPSALHGLLQAQLQRVRRLHERDQARGLGRVVCRMP